MKNASLQWNRVLLRSACICTIALAQIPSTLALAQSANPAAKQPSLEAQEANEPMESGAAAKGDAAALQDAFGTPSKPGWYETAKKTRDQRLEWWRDARFGCFIHWGPYSVLGGDWQGRPNPGYAEHIMRVDKIPFATYRDQVAARFQPNAWDAKELVRQIKAAGMGYIIITAKHHDGFALWPSEANPYNLRDTSHFQRDPLGELVKAAREAHLHVGFYYSHAFDWQDPDAPGNDWDYNNPGGDKQLFGGVNWYQAHPEFLQKTQHYVDTKAIPQLRELIARYHPDIFWFDTPGKLPFYQQEQIIKAVREADPNVVINGRAARNDTVNLGDYLNTADRAAEIRPTAGDWEAMPTTNESYGYNKLDPVHKPVSYFIQLLAKAAAKGGNILLNIGPRGDGTLDPPDTAILQGIGQWMSANGDSIRGTQRTPLDRQAWGDSTVKGNTLYLHVWNWPTDGKLVLSGLEGKVLRANLLQKPSQPLRVSRLEASDLEIAVPRIAPDPVDTVIVLRLASPPRGVAGNLVQADVSVNRLLAFDAEANGSGFSYGDGKASRYYIDGLEREGNNLAWKVRSRARRRYRVEAVFASAVAKKSGVATLNLKLGDTELHGEARSDGNVTNLQRVSLGEIEVPEHLTSMTLTMTGDPLHFFEVDLIPEP
jgi:alpha-L-fucosidase